MNAYLAFDIGASSGRAIVGLLKENNLELEEIHRFDNGMIYQNGHYHWNVYQLFEELKVGLKKCVTKYNIQPKSIGIDTWGVDFGLLNKEGDLLGLPFAYRDSITDGAPERLKRIITKEKLYTLTGLQEMQFNSIYQLFALQENKYSCLNEVKDLLFMPDLLSYFFSGEKKNEYTIASTSQLLNAQKRNWEEELFSAIGIDKRIVQDLVEPGSVIGNLLPNICSETGSECIPVIAVASHDTASAVISAPANSNNWAYLSSGTWSLMGVETQSPQTKGKAQELNFTNEGGAEGSIRLLKNIIGMWLIQECRRAWTKENEYTWPEMVELAKGAKPFKYLINPDNAMFLNPDDMPLAIQDYCEKTGQGRPTSHAEIIRAIYDSLALKYKSVLNQLQEVTGEKISTLHIVGGGSNNLFLNQLSADICGIEVISGPTEATAIGNIMIQAKADAQVKDLSEIRSVIRRSFDVKVFTPTIDTEGIDTIYNLFKSLD